MRDTMDMKDNYLISVRNGEEELWLTGRNTLIEARKEAKRLRDPKTYTVIMRLHLWGDPKCPDPESEAFDFTCHGRDLVAAIESELTKKP